MDWASWIADLWYIKRNQMNSSRNMTNLINEAARELACFEGADINLENAVYQLAKILDLYSDTAVQGVRDVENAFDFSARRVLELAPKFKN